MLAFGHLGITLGAALAARGIASRIPHRLQEDPASASEDQSISQAQKSSSHDLKLVSFIRRIDIRLLLVGSLLPDIIDKPVGQIIFRESISNGRIFCHTLLFLLLITACGLVIFRYSLRDWLLILALGTLSHHILDKMWQQPATFYWPVFGFNFPKLNSNNFLYGWFQSLLTNPETFISEAIGLTIFLALALWLLKRKSLYAFIRSGQIPD
jgi:membrane-bound metal-dependent hydrolase YbcI (DUF457 family)